jgi:hypothetical protein
MSVGREPQSALSVDAKGGHKKNFDMLLNSFGTIPNSISAKAIRLGKNGGAAWGGALVPMLLQGECGYENL